MRLTFLWKVSLKILNSGLILKTFTHALLTNVSLEEKSVDQDQTAPTLFVLEAYKTLQQTTKADEKLEFPRPNLGPNIGPLSIQK